MDKFQALADPTRRSIIEALASQGELSATEIADRFPISPQAVSQHLKVLREARWVQVEKRAQQRIYRINRQATVELEDWAHRLRMLWTQRFDALEQLIEAEKQRIDSENKQSDPEKQQVDREIASEKQFRLF
jgi:DNA-binding transcriptional ArsR family regulator